MSFFTRRAGWAGVLLALTVMPLSGGTAQGQALAVLGEGREALEVSAEEALEWRREERLYLARGNAVARRGDLTVSAPLLSAYYRETAEGNEEIYRLEATGGVIIESPTERVSGDRAVYDLDAGHLELRGGDLRLEMPEQVVTARDSLEYWQDFEGEPVAVARGDAVVERVETGERVEGDVLTAAFDRAAAERLVLRQADLTGNVRVYGDEVFATAEKAIYNAAEDTAYLEGDVRITRGQNQLNGSRAEIELRTGVSRLLGNQGGPVRALLTPEPRDSTEEAQ